MGGQEAAPSADIPRVLVDTSARDAVDIWLRAISCGEYSHWASTSLWGNQALTNEDWADLARQLIEAVKDDAPSITDWISAIATALTLGIAIVAAFFAKGQLNEASRAREQSKKLELEKSQPYVVMSMEESVGPEFIDIVIRNYGQRQISHRPVLSTTKPEHDPWSAALC